MDPVFSLDIPYWLNPRVMSSVKSADSMAVFGTGTPLELSLDLFRVLISFAEKKTIRQAFQALDVDGDIDEFARIIGKFFDCGLLRRELPDDERQSLQRLLNPEVFSDSLEIDKIGAWMRLGRAVVIPDALPMDLAEQVYSDLDHSTDWRITEGGHDFFHYRNCGLDGLEERSPALAQCSRLFASAATRRFMQQLSGQDCAGEADVTATWYRPGEYALPHDDSATNGARSVAYIWYLTKDWRQEWGGSLFWCPTGQYIRPRFNALTIFNVTSSNVHFVCPVAHSATAKRLSLNGFWHRTERGSPSPPVSSEAIVSHLAYGQPAPDVPKLASMIVL